MGDVETQVRDMFGREYRGCGEGSARKYTSVLVHVGLYTRK